tara:strand:- start:950 stop:1282 length:333 start_codon:yes stop_codon:yes gene_type:complete
MRKLLLGIGFIVALNSCVKDKYIKKVEYSAKTNIKGFSFRYVGLNGDTNTTRVNGDRVKVMPIYFYYGEVAWCEIKSDEATMGEVRIITGKDYEIKKGLAFDLSIKQLIE